jgi:hypothetical protein
MKKLTSLLFTIFCLACLPCLADGLPRTSTGKLSSAQMDASVVLTIRQGGTNTSSFAGYGAIVSNDDGTALTTVAPGANGNVLTSNGTDWMSSAGGGGAVTSVSNSDGCFTVSPTIGDAAISKAKGMLQYKHIQISADDWKATKTTPVTILAAPNASELYVIYRFLVTTKYNTTTYSNGGSVYLSYNGNPAYNASTESLPYTVYALTSGTKLSITDGGGYSTGSNDYTTNYPIGKSVNIRTSSSNPTTGNSPVDVYIWYATITP